MAYRWMIADAGRYQPRKGLVRLDCPPLAHCLQPDWWSAGALMLTIALLKVDLELDFRTGDEGIVTHGYYSRFALSRLPPRPYLARLIH